MDKKLRVGMAYDAFTLAFQRYFPGIEIITTTRNIKKYDLIIFSGGADINPNIYGARNTYSYCANSNRDRIETDIFKHAYHYEVKMLGVCRGHQLINALKGGYLVQNLELEGDGDHGSGHVLEKIMEGSFVEKIYRGGVNSIHHQGVSRIGRGLLSTSVYKGVSESTESENIITVQWHPEFMQDDLFFNYLIKWVVGEYKPNWKSSKKETSFYQPKDYDEYLQWRERMESRVEPAVAEPDRVEEPPRPAPENPFRRTADAIDTFTTTATAGDWFINSDGEEEFDEEE